MRPHCKQISIVNKIVYNQKNFTISRNGVIAKNEGGGVNFSPGESINLESRNSLETAMLGINSQIRVRKVSPGRNCVCGVRLRYGTRLSHLRGCNDTPDKRNSPRGRNCPELQWIADTRTYTGTHTPPLVLALPHPHRTPAPVPEFLSVPRDRFKPASFPRFREFPLSPLRTGCTPVLDTLFVISFIISFPRFYRASLAVTVLTR